MSSSPSTRRARAAALHRDGRHRGRHPGRLRRRDDDGGEATAATPTAITVWIEEDLPDRVAATQAIVDAFTTESGRQGQARRRGRGPVQPDPHLERRGRRPPRRDRRRCRWARSGRCPPTS